jgi:hypothetical protein
LMTSKMYVYRPPCGGPKRYIRMIKERKKNNIKDDL